MTAQPIKSSRPDTINLAVIFFFSLLVVICIPGFSFSQEAQRAGNRAAKGASENTVARGEYIVEGLAVCSQCHTPHDSNGSMDRAHWLDGAAVWLKPAEPVENWPLLAPRIAGNPPGTDAEMVKLLTTGIWRDGKPLRAPMPQFRMSHSDAEAVVAYLKSIQPATR